MRRKLLNVFVAVILLFIPKLNFGQAPPLGATSSFALFTAAGAFNVAGASTIVTGDVGTNVGAFNAFPPGTLIGQIHVADAISATAATDVALAYGSLNPVTCGQVISTTLGNGQILLPDVYCTGAATTVNGNLILDGQGDPTSVFIFKFDGALATTVDSRIILTNGASLCNVWWQVNGEVNLGESSLFQGTLLVNGAIHLMDSATLIGRGLSQAGAISLQNNIVTLAVQPTASVITAGGSITFCTGDSVTLSGNIGGTWSTGATTSTITVTTDGDFFVTNTENCGSIISNHIIVTVNPIPICSITGDTTICMGGSSQLCAPAGLASYLWNTGATTQCIAANVAGTFTVTVTSADGCSSSCNATVIENIQPVCFISGDTTLCMGGSTQLCAPAGLASYLWSTGATTQCIAANAAGTFTVSVTSANGCSSSCNATVIENIQPVCTITGDTTLCTGGSTQLCAPAGLASYLWSTGATTQCVSANAAGTFTVIVTSGDGCISSCNATVIENNQPVCSITGDTTLCTGGSTQLCAPAGLASYLWNTGATTQCISANAAGTFTVTVTNSGGCKSTCSKTVILGKAPSCSITGNGNICTGGSTQLCAPAGLASYLWSTGATTQCISANTTGTFTVTVTNSNGCKSTCSKTVTLGKAPNCNITGNSSICTGGSTQLCAPAGLASYLWSTGATTQCISANIAGTFTVTATNSSGCKSTCSKTVTLGKAPSCNISGNSSICIGGSTQLCAPAGLASYLWSTGATTQCVSANTTGTFTVTVTNSSGCKSTCSKTVTNGKAPSCNITGNSSICIGGSTQLCAPAGLASYLWSTGATTRCISANTTGTFTVTVTNSSGCKSTCSKTVTNGKAPSCTITGNGSICTGGSTQLCAPAGLASYLWSTGATTRCINVSSAGTRTVTVTNSIGCSSTCSKTVTIGKAPSCTISGKGSICTGGSTQLCSPTGYATYLWSTGATTRCINVSTAGTRTVIVTNSNGCSSTCSKSVSVKAKPSCYITGNLNPIVGQNTTLCAPYGYTAYLWNTGATTRCISVANTGTYSVTVTNSNSCTNSCNTYVTYHNARSNSGLENTIVENNDKLEVNAYPNPFNSIAIIEFRNRESNAHTIVELYGLTGNKIATLFDRNITQDLLYKVEVNAENLLEGIYIYRIVSGDHIINKKIILIK